MATELHEALASRHQDLSERLELARAVEIRPEQSRRGCPPIDLFCSHVSKHMHAVDAVLVPAARRAGADETCSDYIHAAREAEVVLAHVKAHEYGSAIEQTFDWTDVWDDVERSLADQWQHELRLADVAVHRYPGNQRADMVAAIAAAEQRAPTRPHPYMPHTGPVGSMSRGVMRVADAFWDAVEGRYVPEKRRPPKKKPGLIGQYLMADPRFDEEEPPEEPPEDDARPARSHELD